MPLFSHNESMPVVVGTPMEEFDAPVGTPVEGEGAPALEAQGSHDTLDQDLSELLALGLQLSDVEQLWHRQNAEVDPESAAGRAEMGEP